MACSPEQESSTLHDIWILEKIDGKEAILGEGSPVQLEIYVKEMRFLGYGGCNNYSGKVSKLSDSEVQFGPAMSTRKFCQGSSEQENLYLQSLEKVRSWKVEKEWLSLLDESGKVLLEFGKTD